MNAQMKLFASFLNINLLYPKNLCNVSDFWDKIIKISQPHQLPVSWNDVYSFLFVEYAGIMIFFRIFSILLSERTHVTGPSNHPTGIVFHLNRLFVFPTRSSYFFLQSLNLSHVHPGLHLIHRFPMIFVIEPIRYMQSSNATCPSIVSKSWTQRAILDTFVPDSRIYINFKLICLTTRNLI